MFFSMYTLFENIDYTNSKYVQSLCYDIDYIVCLISMKRITAHITRTGNKVKINIVKCNSDKTSSK